MEGASKTMVIFCLGTLLLSSLIANPMLADATDISYGAMNPTQKRYHDPLGPPTNPYTRGCEEVERCRGGNGK
ncbi:hypothetical protein U1Q18_024448 [Sarracenia purpurea var. burkii]